MNTLAININFMWTTIQGLNLDVTLPFVCAMQGLHICPHISDNRVYINKLFLDKKKQTRLTKPDYHLLVGNQGA
jgi:hypothetical protein